MCDNLEIAPNTQSFEFLRGLCSSDDDAVFGVFVGGDRARLKGKWDTGQNFVSSQLGCVVDYSVWGCFDFFRCVFWLFLLSGIFLPCVRKSATKLHT
jgi:hypothetical protein